MTYKSRVRKHKRPPSHLERHVVPCKSIFPERPDTDKEKPHSETPEPEADQNADDLDDTGNVWRIKEIRRYKQVCLAAKLG